MVVAAKRGIVFDFDGVIADSWSLHEQCWRIVLERHGLPLDEADLVATAGWSAVETGRHLVEKLPGRQSTERLATEKIELFADRSSELMPMPGSTRAIRRLSEEFAISVTASRPRPVVAAVLERFELPETLETLTTADELSDKQELDDLFRLAAKKLELDPKRCAMIDDSRNGILAAKRIDMNTIAYASNPKHEIDYSMADAEITALDALVPELINQVIVS